MGLWVSVAMIAYRYVTMRAILKMICMHCVHMYMLRSLCWVTYCISSIRCHGYYLFAAHFVQLLYEGSVYFFGKPRDINDGLIRYVRVRR